MTKKEIFRRQNGKFSQKGHSKIWSVKFFFRPPKLRAKSPPMGLSRS